MCRSPDKYWARNPVLSACLSLPCVISHSSSSTSRSITVSCTFWIMKISTSWSSLFSFQCSDFGFTAYVSILLITYVLWCITLFSLFFWCPCLAINVSVQYNGGLLPDIILLTQCYYHRGTRLNAMKRFCICSLWSHLNVLHVFPLTEGCSEGLGAFWFLFK